MQSLVPDRDSCFRIASMSAKGPLTFLRLSFLNHKITAGMQQVLNKCSFPFCTPLGMEERGAEARMLRGEDGQVLPPGWHFLESSEHLHHSR